MRIRNMRVLGQAGCGYPAEGSRLWAWHSGETISDMDMEKGCRAWIFMPTEGRGDAGHYDEMDYYSIYTIRLCWHRHPVETANDALMQHEIAE